MQGFVEQMKTKEAAGEIPRPKGAGPNAVGDYVAALRSYSHPLDHIPHTPAEANTWWDTYMREHPDNHWAQEAEQGSKL